MCIRDSFHLDAGWQQRLQRVHLRLDGFHGLDDVGIRLAADHQQHRRTFVVETAGIAVLHAFTHLGHVGEMHGAAFAHGHHQSPVFLGGAQLQVGFDLPLALCIGDIAQRLERIGTADGIGHFVQGKAVLVQRIGIQ